jgi:hypothetical protein
MDMFAEAMCGFMIWASTSLLTKVDQVVAGMTLTWNDPQVVLGLSQSSAGSNLTTTFLSCQESSSYVLIHV